MTPCKHSEDGYCIRAEKEYCYPFECACPHTETEKRFVDYLFTLELYAIFCKKCNKQLSKLIAV